VARAKIPVDEFTSYAVSVAMHGPSYCVEATLRDGAVVLGYGRLTVIGETAVIRDLRVLGDMTPIGQREGGPQHIGIGTAMLRTMEDIAKARFCTTLRVHPPVGASAYFARLGFREAGPTTLKGRLSELKSAQI